MSKMKDQLGDTLFYPASPGFKGEAPSREAAVKMQPSVRTLRDRAFMVIRNASHGLTADEVASQMGRSVLSVRPRIAELHRLGLIAPAKERRTNSSGMTATVWTLPLVA